MTLIAGSFDRRRNDGSGRRDARPDAGLAGSWHISLRFTLDAFRHGIDPLKVVQQLRGLARDIVIATVDDRLPSLNGMNAMSCHLGFEIQLSTESTRADIEAVLNQASNDCIVRIFSPNRRASDFIALIHALPEEGRLGDILVECGAISRESLDQAIEQQESATRSQALGEILIGHHKVSPGVVGAALVRQSHAREQRSADAYLADMLELTDQLLSRGAKAHQEALLTDNPVLNDLLRQMQDLANDLQTAVDDFRAKKPKLTQPK